MTLLVAEGLQQDLVPPWTLCVTKHIGAEGYARHAGGLSIDVRDTHSVSPAAKSRYSGTDR